MRLASVRACGRRLNDTISTLPIDTYRRCSSNPLLTTPAVLAEPADGMVTA